MQGFIFFILFLKFVAVVKYSEVVQRGFGMPILGHTQI